MACPTIRIALNRSYEFYNGVYNYNSTAIVEVVSGTTSSPLQGSLTIRDFSGNEVVYPAYNPTGSFLVCTFNIPLNAFYTSNDLTFELSLNDGECLYTKNIQVNYDDFNCYSGYGENHSPSNPHLLEACFPEYFLTGTGDPILGCTNPNSTNYNPLATQDDGSCTCDCPVIELNVIKESIRYVGTTGSTFDRSIAQINVVSGTSTSPIQATLQVTDLNNNVTNYTLVTQNATSASFNLDDSAFFNQKSASFSILLNSGTCVYAKTLNFDDLPCTLTPLGKDEEKYSCSGSFTIGGSIYGCTNPNAENYNPCATIDDGSCVFPPLLGCTDPNAANYNPLATQDDGSCVYTPVNTFVLGCTNPYASNYNPNANFNDGSCIFVSGCTNPDADNYNPLAGIDDGSCECNKAEILFELDGENTFYFENSGTTNCDYYVEFDYRFSIDCTLFLNYFQNHTQETVVQLLDQLRLYSEVRSADGVYRQIELDINPLTDDKLYFELSGCSLDYLGSSGCPGEYITLTGCSSGCTLEYYGLTGCNYECFLNYLTLSGCPSGCTFEYTLLTGCPSDLLIYSGCTEDCLTFKALLAAELGEKCPQDVNDFFDNSWRTARLRIPNEYLNKDVQVGMYLENFSFKGTKLLMDNVKLYKICSQDNTDCIVIPYNFGFDLSLEEDNVKATYDLDTNKDILNTKEITLRVDVPNYVKKDVVKFLNTYEHLYHKIFKGMTLDKLDKNFLPVRSLFTNEYHYYYCHLYEQYMNSFKFCSAKSKELDYDFMFKVLEKIDKEWYSLVKQVIPETVIWTEHNVYYSNFIFHQQKFAYRKYLTTYGSNPDEVTISCILKAVDSCEQNPTFESAIDTRLRVDYDDCLEESYANPTNISETNYGGGRLLQVNKTTKEKILEYNYPNQTYIDCP